MRMAGFFLAMMGNMVPATLAGLTETDVMPVTYDGRDADDKHGRDAQADAAVIAVAGLAGVAADEGVQGGGHGSGVGQAGQGSEARKTRAGRGERGNERLLSGGRWRRVRAHTCWLTGPGNSNSSGAGQARTGTAGDCWAAKVCSVRAWASSSFVVRWADCHPGGPWWTGTRLVTFAHDVIALEPALTKRASQPARLYLLYSVSLRACRRSLWRAAGTARMALRQLLRMACSLWRRIGTPAVSHFPGARYAQHWRAWAGDGAHPARCYSHAHAPWWVPDGPWRGASGVSN